MLEQPFEHLDAMFDLEVERAIGEPRRRGRSEQIGALERAVPLGQPSDPALSKIRQ
jgi:hypothetical protein